MSNLSDKVIEIAARNLRIMGCKFIILTPFGTTIEEGGLSLEVKKAHTKRHVKKNDFKRTGYIDIIKAMEPGDVYEFVCEGDYTPEEFQKAISSTAHNICGSNNFKTSTSKDSVHLIVFAKKGETGDRSNL